jgi:hypothetical protein
MQEARIAAVLLTVIFLVYAFHTAFWLLSAWLVKPIFGFTINIFSQFVLLAGIRGLL